MRQGSTAARLEGKKASLASALQCVLSSCRCCLAALSLTSAACHRAQANTLPESPPLEVPAVPPREVEPIEVKTPQPMPLPEEPRTRRLRACVRPSPGAASRTTENGTTEDRTAAAEPRSRTKSRPNRRRCCRRRRRIPKGIWKAIRASLTRAQTDLNRIDYRALNADARVQYQTAKSFIRQAEQAVRAKNLLFAKNLAEKAAALAAQLAPKIVPRVTHRAEVAYSLSTSREHRFHGFSAPLAHHRVAPRLLSIAITSFFPHPAGRHTTCLHICLCTGGPNAASPSLRSTISRSFGLSGSAGSTILTSFGAGSGASAQTSAGGSVFREKTVDICGEGSCPHLASDLKERHNM